MEIEIDALLMKDFPSAFLRSADRRLPAINQIGAVGNPCSVTRKSAAPEVGAYHTWLRLQYVTLREGDIRSFWISYSTITFSAIRSSFGKNDNPAVASLRWPVEGPTILITATSVPEPSRLHEDWIVGITVQPASAIWRHRWNG
jgi:hypothetical protein